MEVLLKQLGELVLGSVPTMILFILLVLAYEALVRRPLDRVLAERRARTTGAVEQARGAIAAAEAETSVYEDKLRSARAELLTQREHRIAGWNAEREQMLGEVRRTAGDRVGAAKSEIERGAGAARAQIESSSSELSSRILAAVLPAGVSVQEEAR